MIVVVMGVCGCGKTTIGRMLAERLDAAFIEGDELHPFANKDKMTAGMPLEDADREPWLDAIAAKTTQLLSRVPCVVVSCSALKRAYRDRLRTAGENLHLVHLTGAESLLQARMIERRGHFMPAGLLASQLATLQVPEADETAVNLDIAGQPGLIVEAALAFLKFHRQPETAERKPSHEH